MQQQIILNTLALASSAFSMILDKVRKVEMKFTITSILEMNSQRKVFEFTDRTIYKGARRQEKMLSDDILTFVFVYDALVPLNFFDPISSITDAA